MCGGWFDEIFEKRILAPADSNSAGPGSERAVIGRGRLPWKGGRRIFFFKSVGGLVHNSAKRDQIGSSFRFQIENWGYCCTQYTTSFFHSHLLHPDTSHSHSFLLPPTHHFSSCYPNSTGRFAVSLESSTESRTRSIRPRSLNGSKLAYSTKKSSLYEQKSPFRKSKMK